MGTGPATSGTGPATSGSGSAMTGARTARSASVLVTPFLQASPGSGPVLTGRGQTAFSAISYVMAITAIVSATSADVITTSTWLRQRVVVRVWWLPDGSRIHTGRPMMILADRGRGLLLDHSPSYRARQFFHPRGLHFFHQDPLSGLVGPTNIRFRRVAKARVRFSAG